MISKWRGIVAVAAVSCVCLGIYACSGDDKGTSDAGPDATKDAVNDVRPDVVADAGCSDGNCVTQDAGCSDGGCALEVSAGFYSSCALMGDQTVWCWGQNTYGEVAPSSTGDVACSAGPCRPTAQQVTIGDGGVKAQHVSVGQSFACIVDTTGQVWCWGRNDRGQLGHAPTNDPDAGGVAFNGTPSVVGGLPTATNVTAGFSTACAITSTGTAFCWGDNTSNELGLAEAGAAIYPPTQVSVITPTVASIEAAQTVSQNHLCARKSDGTAWCWASNFYGERGSAPTQSPPSQMLDNDGGAITDITSLAAAKYSTCTLRTGGALWCWGQDISDVFGNPNVDAGTTVNGVVRSDTGSVSFTSINGHTIHMCGLTSNEDLYCWGDNSYGEVGLGKALDAGPPSYNSIQKLPFSARAISAGYLYSLAIKPDGTVWGWGNNSYGQVGHAQSSSDQNGCPDYCTLTPTQVQGLPH